MISDNKTDYFLICLARPLI